MNTSARYSVHTIDRHDAVERMILIALATALALVGALYMYLVGHAAYAAADRRIASHEAARVEGQIALLEGRYQDVRAMVTSETIARLGLTTLVQVAYAGIRGGPALSLEVR